MPTPNGRTTLCGAAAHAPSWGLVFPLGSYTAGSPRLALRWLRQRVCDVADQLAIEAARPVREWLADPDQHEHALGTLAAGRPYTYVAHDEGIRYVFTAGTVTPPPPPPSTGPPR